MGQVLAFLSGPRAPSDIIIDFENAKPNTTKSETYEPLKHEMLVNGSRLLGVIQKYGEGARRIRGRLLGCKDEEEAPKLFCEFLPQVNIIKEFYDFAQTLGDLLPRLAKELIHSNDLEHQQAMIKLFADVLDFIRQFDTAKTYAPELQNDFAFFKRSLGKFGKTPEVQNQIPFTQQEASVVSLFLGPSGPMTTFLGDKMAKAYPEKKERDELISLLANLANILCTCVMQKKMKKPDSVNYCMGAMVGAIVMYDYISSLNHASGGVFARDAKIDIKSCCKMIRGKSDLCACVKYSTKTYNTSAPDKIRGYLNYEGATK